MDDNIINQNQNFYIPKNDDDEKEDSTTVSDGSTKKDDAINHRDINVHDPYDFILGNVSPVKTNNGNEDIGVSHSSTHQDINNSNVPIDVDSGVSDTPQATSNDIGWDLQSNISTPSNNIIQEDSSTLNNQSNAYSMQSDNLVQTPMDQGTSTVPNSNAPQGSFMQSDNLVQTPMDQGTSTVLNSNAPQGGFMQSDNLGQTPIDQGNQPVLNNDVSQDNSMQSDNLVQTPMDQGTSTVLNSNVPQGSFVQSDNSNTASINQGNQSVPQSGSYIDNNLNNSQPTINNSDTMTTNGISSNMNSQIPNVENVTSQNNFPPMNNLNDQINMQGSTQYNGATLSDQNINTNPNIQNNNVPPVNGEQIVDSQVNVGQNIESNIAVNQTESIMGIISYVLGVNIITFIISIIKKDNFIKFHSLQSIFFNILFLIIFFVFRDLSHGFLSLGFLIANVVLFIIWILLSIFLMYKAFIGDRYSFTFFGKLVGLLVK